MNTCVKAKVARGKEVMAKILSLAVYTGLIALACCQPATADTLQVPEQYGTIQAGVDAALPGDTVSVGPGVYQENVIVANSAIRLVGRLGAILDGARLGGIGLCVLAAEGVDIYGFRIRNFERGIVLIDAAHCRVSLNEVYDSLDQNPADGAFNMADGIVLIGSDFCDICFNYIHDNGHNGIFLLGTLGNRICFNLILEHGIQTGAAVAGCGIQLSGAIPNDGNDIVANQIRGSAWGILLEPGGQAAENLVMLNDIDENRRAGIAIRGTSHIDNVIKFNDARGNGLANLAPSFEFDLFEEDETLDNVWRRNRGTQNF